MNRRKSWRSVRVGARSSIREGDGGNWLCSPLALFESLLLLSHHHLSPLVLVLLGKSQNRVLATSLTSLMRKMHMRQTLSLPIFPFPADFHLRVHPSVRLPVRPARSTCSRQLKSESRKGEDAAKVIMAFHPSV